MAIRCKLTQNLGTLLAHKDFGSLIHDNRPSSEVRRIIIQESSRLEEMDGNITISSDYQNNSSNQRTISELFNLSNLILITRYGYARTSNFYSTFRTKLDLQIHIMANVIDNFCLKINSMEATFQNTLLYFASWRQFFIHQQAPILNPQIPFHPLKGSDFKDTPYKLIDFQILTQNSSKHQQRTLAFIKLLDNQSILLGKLLVSYQVTIKTNLDNLKQKGQFSQLIEFMSQLQKEFSSSHSNLSKQLYNNSLEKVTNPSKNLFVIEFKMCSMMKILKNGIMKQACQLEQIQQEMIGTITENYNLIIGSVKQIQCGLKDLVAGFQILEMPAIEDQLQPLEYGEDLYKPYKEYIKNKLKVGKYADKIRKQSMTLSEKEYDNFQKKKGVKEDGEIESNLDETFPTSSLKIENSKEYIKSDTVKDDQSDIMGLIQDSEFLKQEQTNNIKINLPENLQLAEKDSQNLSLGSQSVQKEDEPQMSTKTNFLSVNSPPQRSPRGKLENPLKISQALLSQSPERSRSKSPSFAEQQQSLKEEFKRQQKEALQQLKKSNVLSEEEDEPNQVMPPALGNHRLSSNDSQSYLLPQFGASKIIEEEQNNHSKRSSTEDTLYSLNNHDVIKFFMDYEVRYNRESVFMVSSTVCKLWKKEASQANRYCILILDIFGNMIIIYREREEHLASYNYHMEHLKEMINNRIGFYVPVSRIETRLEQKDAQLSISVLAHDKNRPFKVRMEIIDPESTQQFLHSLKIYQACTKPKPKAK